jgi:cyanophycinase-like exopeptidase
VTGPIALHGGGEFLPGDEPFLRAILELAPRDSGVVRIAVVPTSAARGRPDLAAANGVAAFRRLAGDVGVEVVVEAVRVVDAASAADPALAETLAASTLIHFPGGDPDIIPTLYPGTAAWAAIGRARATGAVLAGASAGAMGLAAWTWTPAGVIPALGLVPGVIVAPHADATSWARWVARFGGSVPAGVGPLGLAERTGVIVPGEGGGSWRVVGEGEARWLPPGATDAAATIIARHGGMLDIGAGGGESQA